ncbi:MAG: ammonium transporter [Deltaproteobacteria bacterium]|nr:ammonium transporter [Deltaproteobacteria bacterium]
MFARLFLSAPILALLIAAPAFAENELDTGDTAWILASTALVLFMTLPGLALFYGGLVRTKNVLSVLMQCLALAAVITVLWTAFGYSLAFSEGGTLIGGFEKSFLRGITADTLTGTIPEVLFFVFQMTFAIITPALMIGAFAERMKFSAMMWFCVLWLVVVYLPICHMTWGGGWFSELGVFDFAGGIVVHITAGIGALVACIVIGPRNGYPKTPMLPHNLTMCVTGTGMLWVGWYGFNGGSALGANGGAAMAAVVTQISAATAACTWMAIEWVRYGKPSVLGIATGAIAGLAAVTPASGYIGPVGGLAIGLASGALCYLASTSIKRTLGYDDSLDVFGVHGVGGFVGTLLAAVFASEIFGGNQGALPIASQFGIQLLAAVVTVVYTAAASWVILKSIEALIGLRVHEEDETRGLDVSLHEERGYDY